MTLDVRGGLKNTAINQSDYVVLEEMFSNAIDSYLIRRNAEADAPPFLVKIRVDIVNANLFGDQFDVEIYCVDNGAGFGDEQVKAFVTKDSTYKDYLQIQGIGKCKGAGRIQFFHHFQRLSIDSVYRDKAGLRRRTLNVDSSTREISESSFGCQDAGTSELSTTVAAKNLRIRADRAEDQRVETRFSCHTVVDHLYTAFLQRLIILKGIIGNFTIEVATKMGDKLESAQIMASDLPTPREKKTVPLLCSHGNRPKPNHPLSITRYSFPSADFPEFQHEVALCANSAIVQPITRYFLKNPVARRSAIDGFYELILVESEELEAKVNQQRDGFDIRAECSATEELEAGFSLEDVIESLEDYVYEVITPKDFDRAGLVKTTEEKFGITQSMLESANIKIHFGDTEENIARRVLKKFQDDIVADTSNIFRVKQELLTLDPRSEDFRGKVNELAWKYTSTIKKMDMTNLSQLVVRRSAMIEVLRFAVSKVLQCQNESGKRNEHERIIHNVFFPTGKDDSDVADHDIWLLSEEYQYFEHIASDKPLSSLTWLDGQKLFDSDVDDELLKMFSANNAEHKAKRPDIALFNQEGAAIIIEFKAPDVEIQEHVNDLAQYARLLASKSHGKLRRFFGYLIGGSIEHTRVPLEWTAFPNDKGYFYTGALVDRVSRINYGELYSEMLFYQDFIDRAERRLEVYKEKLNVQL